MTLQQIIACIQDQCDAFKKVGMLTDIDDIDKVESDVPAVFLFASKENAQGSDGAGSLTNQPVEVEVSFLVIAKVPDDTTDYLQPVRDQLFAALVGWEADDEQFLFSSGEIESITGGLIRWRDNYQYTRHLRYTR